MRLLMLARAAMASMRAPPKPFSVNSRVAAARIAALVRSGLRLFFLGGVARVCFLPPARLVLANSYRCSTPARAGPYSFTAPPVRPALAEEEENHERWRGKHRGRRD